MKNLLLVFILCATLSLSTGVEAQQQAEPTIKECTDKGGYNTSTKIWKNIPQCEQQRWGICSVYFGQTTGGTSWYEFVQTKNGVKYHCNDFAAAQGQGVPGPSSNSPIDQCLYAQYGTSDWNTLRCNNVHLDVCKALYARAGVSPEEFIQSSNAQEFQCYRFSQQAVTGTTGGTSTGTPSGSATPSDPGGASGAPPGGWNEGSTPPAASSSLSVLQKQCEEAGFLSGAWYTRGCRDIQKEKVQQHCTTLPQQSDAWRSLNCAEFSSAPGMIGGSSGGAQPTNPFGMSGGMNSNSDTSASGTSSSGINCSAKFRNITDIFGWIQCLIGILIPLGLSIAFIVFLWNTIRYVIAPNPTKDNERKQYIFWALTGLFVLVSVWGIVALVSNTFGLGFAVPQLPTK